MGHRLRGAARLLGGRAPAGRLSPVGTDLVAFTGWGSVALCGAAAIVPAAVALPRTGRLPRLALTSAVWTVPMCLAAARAYARRTPCTSCGH